MEIKLPQRQRILVATLYLAVLVLVYRFIGGDFTFVLGSGTHPHIIWFFSGALMIILGSYIVEPYFTKPSDAIVNSVAVLVALFGITNKTVFFAYKFVLCYAAGVLLLSIVSIALKDAQNPILQQIGRLSYWIVETLGGSKWIFSLIYLSASYTYFANPSQIISFITVIALWIILTFFDIGSWGVKKAAQLLRLLEQKPHTELGTAIGCENPYLYRIEIDGKKSSNLRVQYGHLVVVENSPNVGSIGMVINKKHLLNKEWLSVYLLRDEHEEPIKLDLKSRKLISEPNSIFAFSNRAYKLDLTSVPQAVNTLIKGNALYRHRGDFVGYVTAGSNINTISFTVLRDTDSAGQTVSEGAILKTTIYSDETLYQVINGNTKAERLENFDSHGYVIGLARKLGKYDRADRSLDVIKWVPTMYSPLFFTDSIEPSADKLRAMASDSIGHLPNTDLEIPLRDINAIVTHNTAILGILGIGKSCLSYELIKRVTDVRVKVICIDITNEYVTELAAYLPGANAITADDVNAFNSINGRYGFIDTETSGGHTKQNYEKSGNVAEYRSAIKDDLCLFLFGATGIPEDKRFETVHKVRIYNIDYHKASKGEKIGFNVITTDLTQAEKTRVIAEELFKILMTSPLEAEKRAKVLLVFEEAHSLIPEWNSVANEVDKAATNGTAKIILQGRKYGLGSLVITQRTANVSKSILNQCNTIFALRVFDDTGKGFLSNYIGSDYADTLATLEERHAIAIGKGLRLKQPIILELNNRAAVIAIPQPSTVNVPDSSP